MGMPFGDSVFNARDRAIIKFFLYSGARIATGWRLNVGEFHRDGDEATIRLHEKGDRRRTIGLHFAASEAIAEYLEMAHITRGPLLARGRTQGARSLAIAEWTNRPCTSCFRATLSGYQGTMKEVDGPGGEEKHRCIFTPHSLRATTATLLLDAGVDICKVQELLGHRHVTTTQIYDKRRRSTSKSASHDVPI